MPAALSVALLATVGTAAASVGLQHRPARAAGGHDVAARTAPSATPAGSAAPGLELPPPPAPAASVPDLTNAAAAGPGAGAATPAVRQVAQVTRPHQLIEPTILVTTPRSMSVQRLRALRHASGVTAAQPVSAGRVVIDGHRAFALGVAPDRFRPWTPKLTAASQPLWQSIARGELTASFDMGHDARLPLGQSVPVRAAHRLAVRVGAFASVGMAGVDAVVAAPVASRLGLRPRTGLVLSVPGNDPAGVRDSLRTLVGPHARVTLLRQVVVVRQAGAYLTVDQINTMLRAAASRVGLPYVWGATGPDSFDCSGLVQWAFAQAGVQMPRVSQQQWFAGPHVSYADARPGDLLFWHYDPTDPGDIDHVAIYTGDGMMLVAPHTGELVQYVPVPLNTAFAGVVRVDPAMASQVGW